MLLPNRCNKCCIDLPDAAGSVIVLDTFGIGPTRSVLCSLCYQLLHQILIDFWEGNISLENNGNLETNYKDVA